MSDQGSPVRVLMVCLGNICRSPMAEGVLRHLAEERGMDITVDSAGTANYHVGEAPDRRARAAMKRKGMDIDGLRGRQVSRADFARFDLLLAMDEENFENLLRLAPDDTARAKVKLMLSYAPDLGTAEVPDPYYGDDAGFDRVFDLLHAACTKLLDRP